MSVLLYRGLFDDAALFPPGNAPMVGALSAHRAHRSGPRAAYVGPFLVSDARLGELRAVLAREEGAPEPLAVAVTVPGGPDGVEPAVAAVLADPALRLVGVEVAAEPGRAAEAAAALGAGLPAGAGGFVEVARQGEVAADLAALAGTGYGAKFRTGGLTARAHPDEEELAAFLHAAVERGVPFKCTAGLHHAVRHTSAEGFEQHGFLNVLMATAALVGGGPVREAAHVLADRDGPRLAALAAALPDDRAAAVRAAFRSFGTCSISEPLEDLVVLGALPVSRTR
ncbi:MULTISPECIES: hypothetical protein [unclassified Nocardiopsis]|uniref:hypothetical protein n=1 Tax=unclassified Nocardiopsis TaxID=2649073 RepID=UPI001357D41E|nr:MULTISPECIES: hypothetical protein [unclassified Nocardiopsis]